VVKVVWHKAASTRTRMVQSYSPGGANVPPCNTWFLQRTRVHDPNVILISVAVFAQLMAECHWVFMGVSFPLKITPLHKEPCIRWGPDCPIPRHNFLWERTCPGMPDDSLPWVVQKKDWTDVFVQHMARVAWSDCLSVCHSSESAKTAEPLAMPFRLWT